MKIVNVSGGKGGKVRRENIKPLTASSSKKKTIYFFLIIEEANHNYYMMNYSHYFEYLGKLNG